MPAVGADVTTGLGPLVLTPVLGVLARGVLEGLVNLCPAVLTVLGVVALGVVDVANLGPCPEVVTMLGEVVLMPTVGVPALGVPEGLVNLCPAVVTALGVPALGVVDDGKLGRSPEVVTTLGEVVLMPIVGVPALGVPEGLINLCPALVTVLGIPTLGVVDVANLGPCPEVVTMLGEVVRMPVVGVPALGVPEGLVNLCPAPVSYTHLTLPTIYSV